MQIIDSIYYFLSFPTCFRIPFSRILAPLCPHRTAALRLHMTATAANCPIAAPNDEDDDDDADDEVTMGHIVVVVIYGHLEEVWQEVGERRSARHCVESSIEGFALLGLGQTWTQLVLWLRLPGCLAAWCGVYAFITGLVPVTISCWHRLCRIASHTHIQVWREREGEMERHCGELVAAAAMAASSATSLQLIAQQHQHTHTHSDAENLHVDLLWCVVVLLHVRFRGAAFTHFPLALASACCTCM